MDDALKDIDARPFYTALVDPDRTFNRVEITLSHLFRRPMPILGGRTYSDCLFDFLGRTGYMRPHIVEVGGGLGDVAQNFLRGRQPAEHPQYTMFDLSPALLQRQRDVLGGLVAQYIQGDALTLSRHLPRFFGLLLCNGVIADLRSVYIGPEDPLVRYGITDPDFEEFLNAWEPARTGTYFHLGTHLFLREVSSVLEPGGTAAILEYSATGLNQPSPFGTHYECGIDFDQVKSYAERLGFRALVVDIEEILGIDRGQEFLTIDAFIAQDRLAHEIPATLRLWESETALDVLAYTRESFRDAVGPGGLGLDASETSALMSSMGTCFHSIHDPRFDSTNPTTWGYRCLLLQKPAIGDMLASAESVTSAIVAEYYGISEKEAVDRVRKHLQGQTMQWGEAVELLVEAIVCGVLWDLIKCYGPVVGKHLLTGAVMTSAAGKLPPPAREKLLGAMARVLARMG